MTYPTEPEKRNPRVGRAMTYGGVVLFGGSFVLGIMGVGPISVHNALQGLGIGLMLLGYVTWKLIKV